MVGGKRGRRVQNNPLEQFAIQSIIPIQWMGYDLSFTNSSLVMVLSVFIIILLQHFSLKRAKLIPGRLQGFYESIYSFALTILKDNAGEEGMKYFPFVFSLFLFVLTGNFLGMIPYSFTFTSHIVVTFALAMMIFIVVTVLGFAKHGLHFFRLFFPPGIPLAIAPVLIPIEIITYFMRPVTLAVRLCANMTAGHVLLKLFGMFTVAMGLFGVFPLIMNILFTGFEFFVAFLQAYIFTILTCIYLNDALHLH